MYVRSRACPSVVARSKYVARAAENSSKPSPLNRVILVAYSKQNRPTVVAATLINTRRRIAIIARHKVEYMCSWFAACRRIVRPRTVKGDIFLDRRKMNALSIRERSNAIAAPKRPALIPFEELNFFSVTFLFAKSRVLVEKRSKRCLVIWATGLQKFGASRSRYVLKAGCARSRDLRNHNCVYIKKNQTSS